MDDTTIGAVGGGLLGALGLRALADSDLLNNRFIARRTHSAKGGYGRYAIPAYVGLGADMQHGSGEGNMTKNFSNALNRHGVGTYLTNITPDYAKHKGFYPRFSDMPPGLIHWGWKPDLNRNAGLWHRSNTLDSIRGLDQGLGGLKTDFGGVRESAVDYLIRDLRSHGLRPDEARRIVLSGVFDGNTPGGVHDLMKLIGDDGVKNLASGRLRVGNAKSVYERLTGNGRRQFPYAFTGEAGMGYNSGGIGRGEDVAAHMRDGRLYPWANGEGRTASLAAATKFNANYLHPDTDEIIPFSRVYDPGFGRRGSFARKLANTWGRRKLVSVARGIAKDNGLPEDVVRGINKGNKFMLISTGSSGINAFERLRAAGEAFKDDPNVRIIMQHGSLPGPSSAGIRWENNNGVLEEAARLNKIRPGMVLTADRVKDYDRIARLVDLHGGYTGSSSATELASHTNPAVVMTDSDLNRLNMRWAQRMRPGLHAVETRGMADARAAGDWAAYDRHLQDAVRTLREAMASGGSQFSPENVARANRVINAQNSRNAEALKTVRQYISSAINRDYAKWHNRIANPVRRNYHGLARALFRTPFGRRVGLPLLGLGILGGAGAGAYAMSK